MAQKGEGLHTWESTKIRGGIYSEIASIIAKVHEHNAPKYASIQDFVGQACKQLLAQEKAAMEAAKN